MSLAELEAKKMLEMKMEQYEARLGKEEEKYELLRVQILELEDMRKGNISHIQKLENLLAANKEEYEK